MHGGANRDKYGTGWCASTLYTGKNMRCAMTGRPLKDTSEGIWDDGEWISWDWINSQLADQELNSGL